MRRLGAFLLLAGCARTVGATVQVPHPLSASTDVADVRYEVIISIKDIRQPEGLAREQEAGALAPFSQDRPAMPVYIPAHVFQQAALLSVRGVDEVRVDVMLTADWRELARLDGYVVELRDDRGVLVAPETINPASERHRDYEATYQAWKNFQTVRLPDRVFAMWAPEEYYVQERVWRGGGALVFRRPGLVRGDTRSLTLLLQNRARTLTFTWVFEKKENTHSP